jgi:hypothetical protein
VPIERVDTQVLVAVIGLSDKLNTAASVSIALVEDMPTEGEEQGDKTKATKRFRTVDAGQLVVWSSIPPSAVNMLIINHSDPSTVQVVERSEGVSSVAVDVAVVPWHWEPLPQERKLFEDETVPLGGVLTAVLPCEGEVRLEWQRA